MDPVKTPTQLRLTRTPLALLNPLRRAIWWEASGPPDGGILMRHEQRSRHVLSQPPPSDLAPPRRLYTPTPNGFERFLRECLVLPHGKRTLPQVHGSARAA